MFGAAQWREGEVEGFEDQHDLSGWQYELQLHFIDKVSISNDIQMFQFACLKTLLTNQT